MPFWSSLLGRARRRSRLPQRIEEARVFYIGGLWRGANDMVRHMELGLRAAGAQVFWLNTDERPDVLDTEGRPYDRGTTGPVWLRLERLEQELRGFRPNLLICNSGGLGLRRPDADRLRPQTFLLGMAFSDPDVFEPTTRHVAPAFDAFLTSSPECVPRYRALGVAATVPPIGTNEQHFHPVPPREELRCDVVLIGHAHSDRIEPVRRLLERFDTHVYGESWDSHGIPSRGLVYGEDFLAVLSSARMSVIFFRTPGGHRLVKPGLFDFTAAGALVLTNRFAEIEPLFLFERELIGFETTDELLQKVAYYLAHPDEAERIRQAGRARTLRDHTWKAIWPRILELVGSLPA